jgi:hypothetical protein
MLHCIGVLDLYQEVDLKIRHHQLNDSCFFFKRSCLI